MQSNRLVYVLNNVWEEEVEGRWGMLFKTRTAPTFPHTLLMMTGKECSTDSFQIQWGTKTNPGPCELLSALFLKIADCLDKTHICYKPKGKTPVQSFPEEPQLGGTSADLCVIPAQSNFKLGCSEPSPVNSLKSARAAIPQPLWSPAATPAPPRTFFLHIPGTSLLTPALSLGIPGGAGTVLS